MLFCWWWYVSPRFCKIAHFCSNKVLSKKGTEYKSTCYVLLSVACISSVLCIFELCTCSSSSLICCFFNTFVCILPCVTNIILKDTLIKGVIWDIFSFRIVFRNIKSTTQLRFVISTIYVCKGCLGFFYCVVLPIICTIWNNYYKMISCQYISYYFDMYYMHYMYSSLPFDNNWILSQIHYSNVGSIYSLYTKANIIYVNIEVGFNSLFQFGCIELVHFVLHFTKYFTQKF